MLFGVLKVLGKGACNMYYDPPPITPQSILCDSVEQHHSGVASADLENYTQCVAKKLPCFVNRVQKIAKPKHC